MSEFLMHDTYGLCEVISEDHDSYNVVWLHRPDVSMSTLSKSETGKSYYEVPDSDNYIEEYRELMHNCQDADEY